MLIPLQTTLFGAEIIQPIPLFLRNNKAALVLFATMNETKHCKANLIMHLVLN